VLKPFIIGLGSTEDFRRAFECVGRYYDANTEEAFDNVLNVVISQALNNTTAQVNLLDAFSKPTETNVNMTFYDAQSGNLLYNYMHTMNEKGKPDTINLDPVYKYRMVVHTIPPVTLSDIEVAAGKHTTIGVDAAQGMLQVKIAGLTNYQDLKCLVKLPSDKSILHVQDANITEKYLTGKYDVEVLTVPRVRLKNIEIKNNQTTSIELPQPGKLSVAAFNQQYVADIYQMERNELVWIMRFPIESKLTNLMMQPGKYKLIYRARGSYRSSQTFEREFIINSGQATNITM
jgi:Ca-activated chloride channel family protein